MNNNNSTKSPMIVSFGEMLIDFVPDVAGVSLADSYGFIKAPGGAPANVACAIAKLGGNAAFIGREFMFYRNPSADMLLKESELKLDLIKQARIFHYGSISLISEPCKSAHLAAMKAAKQAGVLLSYDPNVRLPLWPSHEAARDGIKSIWNEADFVKVSDDEVEFLTKGDPQKDDVVMTLWNDNFKLLIVTDGPNGCRYYTKKFKGKVNGFQVKTVDTTGAGDSFVNEQKLKDALLFANACGAISTTQKGAIPSLPDKAQAEKLIKELK
ncbi:Fructokinase-2 [Hibiscus syriacus]|uniref:Fructokinase-2 n=1 Tax=Hibiscus syriacus TaxID=106335 RepID=A0A6A3AJG4_HIBSY|nr:Fructokinase-2 [Hibiscus syriacus]